MTMPETGFTRADVTDHAVLRYLERSHGLDVKAAREHIASLCANGARYGAHTVAVEDVKFVLVGATVVTTVKRRKLVYPTGMAR